MARKGALEEMVIDRTFWYGKRVFITGHTGFKGSWLSLWLQHLGAEVFGYSLPPPTKPSLYALADVSTGMTSEMIADIRDLEGMKAALRRARPEVIVHMAAQAIVLKSYDDPVTTFSVNVVGTVTLLEAVRSIDTVRVVIVVTSDKCYKNREWVWSYRETDALGGYDPYSASKAATEIAVSAMRRSYFNSTTHSAHRVSIASVRAGNVIGGGDWAEHRLVPDLMRALMEGRRCTIRNPASVRPWQHVLEPLSGYLRLAEALWWNGSKYAGSWNFGPEDSAAKPVSWIADKLGSQWNGDNSVIASKELGQHENVCLKLDSSKARSLLRWSPVWSLEMSLQSIVDWYRDYLNERNMRECVRSQIECFCRGSHKVLAKQPTVLSDEVTPRLLVPNT